MTTYNLTPKYQERFMITYPFTPTYEEQIYDYMSLLPFIKKRLSYDHQKIYDHIPLLPYIKTRIYDHIEFPSHTSRKDLWPHFSPIHQDKNV